MISIAALKILRPINLLITFLSVFIAAIISASVDVINTAVFLSAVSITFSFAGGNIINDIIDYEIDQINRPERVLPRGVLSLNFAKGLYFISVSVSLILAAVVSYDILFFLIALNLLLLLYSTHFKKIILLSNFIVAFATATPLLLGGLVVNNFNGGLIPAGFALFTNLIREIVKDIEDVKGDSAEGLRTLPQKIGLEKTISFTVFLIVLLIVVDTFPYLFSIYNVEYFLIIMVFVNPIYVYSIKIFFTKLNLRSLRKISILIKVSMILGLIAILIGAQ